jgi:branched-chain amino acid transport system ATP-binding protein
MSRLLSVEGLEVRYGEIAALRGFSFHLDEGELVAIVGPNGAGKTTTLTALSGLRQPAAGEIVFDGETVVDAPPESLVRRGIALVPEGRHIFTNLTVRENLEIGGAAGRRSSGASPADELDWVLGIFPALKDLLGKGAGSLSGGEQQQLAIGRALISRPRLLMLDEPSLGLAPLIVQRVFDTVQALREEHGMSILLVEQNARAAIELADRTYVLRQGELALTGSRKELIEKEHIEEAFLGL